MSEAIEAAIDRCEQMAAVMALPDHYEIPLEIVAKMLGQSLAHVRNVVVKREDFPKPSAAHSKDSRLWLVGDVRRFKSGPTGSQKARKTC